MAAGVGRWLARSCTDAGAGADSPEASAAGRNCTTRRRNAHGTEEREVLYPWHPWAGCLVHVHEVIEKTSGAVARCHRSNDPSGCCLEVPLWMFDRVACTTMRTASGPQVDLSAILALTALLADKRGDRSADRPPSSTPRVPKADWISHAGNRGDAHATPSEPSTRPAVQTNPVRSIRSLHRQGSDPSPGMADATIRDAPGADGSDRAPDPRLRSRRSSSRTGTGARR